MCKQVWVLTQHINQIRHPLWHCGRITNLPIHGNAFALATINARLHSFFWEQSPVSTFPSKQNQGEGRICRHAEIKEHTLCQNSASLHKNITCKYFPFCVLHLQQRNDISECMIFSSTAILYVCSLDGQTSVIYVWDYMTMSGHSNIYASIHHHQ
jgi:hypothetical protein